MTQQSSSDEFTIPVGTLAEVENVYGRTCHVARADLDNRQRVQLPLYTRNGKRYSALPRFHRLRGGRSGGIVTIHRENIKRVL